MNYLFAKESFLVREENVALVDRFFVCEENYSLKTKISYRIKKYIVKTKKNLPFSFITNDFI